MAAIIPLSWIFYHVADKPSIWMGRKVESVVFDTQWTLEGLNRWSTSMLASLPFLPSKSSKYILFRMAEAKRYVSRKRNLICVAGFGMLVLADMIILLVFITMKTGSSLTSTISPTLSGSSLSFKSINSSSWTSQNGWAGMNTLITLGDSWTDTAFSFSNPPTPSNPIGATPRFGVDNYWGISGTDGPNWVYGLTARFNQSALLTYNVASAGAIVDSNLITPFRESVLDMEDQVSLILSFFGNSSDEKATSLIAIMLGGVRIGIDFFLNFFCRMMLGIRIHVNYLHRLLPDRVLL